VGISNRGGEGEYYKGSSQKNNQTIRVDRKSLQRQGPEITVGLGKRGQKRRPIFGTKK